MKKISIIILSCFLSCCNNTDKLKLTGEWNVYNAYNTQGIDVLKEYRGENFLTNQLIINSSGKFLIRNLNDEDNIYGDYFFDKELIIKNCNNKFFNGNYEVFHKRKKENDFHSIYVTLKSKNLIINMEKHTKKINL